ncbi:hypothetical protein PV733_28095 [Streptomyces europaeiscabiei]|uniref:hypothetical protein n=1 Tax=Streptomyces europaeiscabiei TaxID=146819 RepID=UPI0029ABD2E6|nr:hypothetical protein [Streptomyces europaeiscabiei]MDX3712732.1 hypothetical protein [Streptomyces europaeiscabiei]
MTTPLTALVFPDVEEMVINQILDVLSYEAATVRPEGDAFTESLPFVQVTRIGGVRVTGTSQGRRLHDDARISLDVYAASRVAATDAMGQVRAAVEQMQGTSRNGGYVLRTWEETGPAVRPEEPNSNVTRIGCTAGLRVRPA